MAEDTETTLTDAEALEIGMRMAEGETETTTQATTETQAESKIKVGDLEFTPEELAEKIQIASQAEEIRKGAHEKFESAAAERKAIDAERECVANLEVVWNGLQNGTPEQRKEIISFLEKSYLPASNGQAVDTSDWEAKGWSSEGEYKLALDIQAIKAENASLKEMMSAVRPVLEDVQQDLGKRRATDSTAQVQAELKAKYNLDMPAEDIATWKKAGIDLTNPMAMELLAPRFAAAASRKTEKVNTEIPANTTNDSTFDPSQMEPDDIYRNIQMGKTPVEPAKV